MKKYRVSRSGKELVERVDDFFIEADKLGAILDDDAIDDDDDSLIGIINSLVQVGDEGITEEEFNETIGGNWEACLPHLELIE